MHLYIHVPFCHKKCHYCAFYSHPIAKKQSPTLINDYLNTLNHELVYWSQQFPLKTIQSVFFGGGTPSILHAQEIQSILNNVQKHYKLLPNAEITLEANPESLNNLSQIKAYLETGINRISLGVQSLNNHQLLSIGRIHTAEQAIQTYTLLREAQCTNINVDLIWGLPNQSLQEWIETLGKTIQLRPNHLSIYNLTIEPNTRFKKEEQTLPLPQEHEQIQMYLQACEQLNQANLEQYEISNFAQKGYQCVQNNGYWDNHDYLGLGPSATSTIHPYRWTNPSNLVTWQKKIKEQQEPPKEFLSPIIQKKEFLMLQLRTTKGLSFEDYKKKTKDDFMHTFGEILQSMIKNRLMYVENKRVKLTSEGMLLSNTILNKLFDLLPNE